MKNVITRGISLLIAIAIIFIPIQIPSKITANAAEGRLYNQNDSQWKNVKFTKYATSGNDMYTSGCGIFSFCNAIYALNGNKPDAVEVATWAVNNGSYQPGNGGVYRQAFYNKVQSAYGERFNFNIDGQYYGKVTDVRLIDHLKNGGVAAIHVSNHFMAITGYNSSNNTYHVIESAVYSGRGLQADSWVSASKMSSGNTNVDWYALISNTDIIEQLKTPKISTDKTSYIIGDTVNISWEASPTNSNLSHYWLQITAPDGTRILNETMNKNTSYSFIPSQKGEYSLTSWATPIGSKEGEGSLTDTKTFNVEDHKWYDNYKPVDIGMNFYAHIENVEKRELLSNINQNVQGADAIGTDNQIWHFVRQDDGSYAILSYYDNLSMDVYCAQNQNGTNIQMMPYVANTAQRFYIYLINGSYYIRPLCSDYILDMDLNSYNIATWEFDISSDSKKFDIYKVDCNGNMPINIGVDFYAHLKCEINGCYLSNIDGNVQGADLIGTKNQIWHFKWQNDGSYSITSYYDDLSMDVYCAQNQNGANIQMMPYVANTAQKFYIYLINDSYYIKPLCSDYVLDMDLNSYNIATWEFDVSYGNKKFNIIKVTPKSDIKGDCNNDNALNIADAVILQKWLLAVPDTELPNWKAADLCEDGKLDAFDMIEMRKLLIQNNSLSAQ